MTTNKNNLMNELKDLLSKYNMDSIDENQQKTLLECLNQNNTVSSAKKTRIFSSSSLRAALEEVENGYYYYAIVGENGYAILRNADNCQNQLNYYKNCEYRGFEYADDAMDWIKENFPTKAHIRNHNFCSLEYMLKYENFWLRRGKVEDI